MSVLALVLLAAVAWKLTRPRRCSTSSIAFIFHDPGARNHLTPIAERARIAGSTVSLFDLRAKANNLTAAQAVRSAPPGSLFVFGCSTNQVELDLSLIHI